VDGLAFDDFSISLSVAEWEIITETMNKIRLDFAAEIKKLSDAKYHETTPKNEKLAAKQELDKKIYEARGPLVNILKLTKDDLHPDDQLSILKTVSLRDSTKKIAAERKGKLAFAKNRILEAYRLNNEIDIKKYAKETRVLS
jgi:hypothetical protein